MAYGVRTRSHIAVDLVMARLKGRVHRVATFFTLTICVAYATLMFYGGLVFVLRLFELGNEARDLPLARWILTIMLPLGFALLTLRFLELAWLFAKGSIKRLGFGEQETPGVSPAGDSGGREPEK
jgi:C4-dicarboxylate transporter DctQ subunit